MKQLITSYYLFCISAFYGFFIFTVYFYKYIRGEEKFASIDALKVRITEDRENIKNYFQCYKK